MAKNRLVRSAQRLSKNLEQRLLHTFNTGVQSNHMDRIMRFLSALGSAWAAIGLCLVFWYLPGYRPQAAAVSFAVVGSHLSVQALKRSVRRTRPYAVVPALRRITAQLQDHSFPSGHTTAAFSVAGVLDAFSSMTAMVVWPLAGLIGISRIYLGHHYPSDVLAGAAIGFSFAVWAGHVFA